MRNSHKPALLVTINSTCPSDCCWIFCDANAYIYIYMHCDIYQRVGEDVGYNDPLECLVDLHMYTRADPVTCMDCT